LIDETRWNYSATPEPREALFLHGLYRGIQIEVYNISRKEKRYVFSFWQLLANAGRF